MKLIKRIVLGFTAVVMMFGMSLGMAVPAEAQMSCFNGRICFWDGANFSGDVVSVTLPPLGGCTNIPDWMENRASSFFNNSPHNMIIWNLDDCQGSVFSGTFFSGPYGSNGNLTGLANNNANSISVTD